MSFAIAVATVAEWQRTHELPAEVIFCCFSPGDSRLYEAELAGAS